MTDVTPISNNVEAPSLSQHSPQVKWQNKKQQAGLCRACGSDRRILAEIEAGVELGKSKLKQLCRDCQDKANTYMNSYRKAKKPINPGPAEIIPAQEEKSNEQATSDATTAATSTA
jgi:hypothetical protein